MSSTATPPNCSLECLSALRVVEYHMVASLAFVVWDYFLTLEDEVEYIWPMRNSVLKWFYFYLRYFPVVSQICHHVVFPALSSSQLPEHLCVLWYRYMMLTLRISTLMVDFILAARAFSLFGRAPRVGAFLGGLLLLDTVAGGVGIAKVDTVEFYESCMLPRARSDVSLMKAIVFLTVLSVIVSMTYFKYLAGVQARRRRVPLISFLVRDATGIYVTMFVISGVALALCGLDDLRAIVPFFWAVSFFSAAGSRLILNMERFSRRHSSEPDRGILLTSRITLY